MDTTELLYDFWYVAAHSGQLKRGQMHALKMLGQPVLLGRDNNNQVFALRDFCPHRGIPLRYGRFDGHEIECCYHGWCFNTQGACTKVPSLAPGDKADISRIKAGRFACIEQEGAIWVYMPPPGVRAAEPQAGPPTTPGPQDKQYYWVDSVTLPCHVDHAVIGLMDPAHGPFVHAAWWWRTQRSMHLKEKQFAPTKLGFKMVSHKPSSNSRAYKILGGDRMTEIAFNLPGLRTEHIMIGTRQISLLTALTPVDEKATVLHQFVHATSPALKALLPLLRPFGRAFIQQDAKVVKMQQEGLQPGHPTLMLLGDADQQALWYFKIKKDWLAATSQNAPFENRIPEKTLRWKS
ncbi:MAG: aromatic ring-hydroxylating dioxygenase subunit alpha [Alphaproteobacteria bacterium]|nr:aromatic ring-hydroxylating dioxygenase subunit alpha [Alphaproteobacteria bacterium]